MLVLTRKTDQSITLGNPNSGEPPLEITVIEVRGDQVRLGITAPQSVAVHRKEIYLQVQRDDKALENRDAARSALEAARSETSPPSKPSTVGMTLDQIRRRQK